MSDKMIFILGVMWAILFGSLLFPQSKIDKEDQITDINVFDAEELVKFETRSYENVIKTSKKSNILLIYYPFYNEIRVVFTCPQNFYDEGDTIIAIRNILLEFIKEKGFYHYSRLDKDLIKYRKDDNGTTIVNYFVHVRIYK